MTTRRTIRAAIVGCGGIANAHARAIAELPNVNLSACADTQSNRAAAFAERYAVPSHFDSIEELLDAGPVELLIIATWPGAYLDLVPHAVGRVPAILCQKPLGRNGSDALRIRELVRQAPRKTLFMEAFMYRHHPQTLRLVELVRDGAIGEVYHLRGVFTQGRSALQNWRRRPELGGGSLMDIGCYALNGVLAMTDARPMTAFAAGWVHPDSGVEERIAGHITFENGVTAQIESSFETPRWRQTLEVVGTRGAIEVVHPWTPDVEGAGLRVYREANRETEWHTYGRTNRYALEIAHLIECLERDEAPRVSLDRSVEAMLTTDALYASMREGRAVEIAALPGGE